MIVNQARADCGYASSADGSTCASIALPYELDSSNCQTEKIIKPTSCSWPDVTCKCCCKTQAGATVPVVTPIPPASPKGDINFTPQVQLPGYIFDASDKSTGNIARYIRAIYKYSIGIVGILAAVVLMIGGVMWIVAGGSATAIGEAKTWIGASLTGLLLALLSYLILATINPALVDFKTTSINRVEQIASGCCEKPKAGGTCSSSITQTQCESGWKPGAYNCNDQGSCVFSLGVCCLSSNTCSYVATATSCTGTKLYGIDCCTQCGLGWYKSNVDGNINACTDVSITQSGSTRSY